MNQQQKNNSIPEKTVDTSRNQRENTSLIFSGNIKIFDPNTQQVFVEKRS